VCGVFVVVGQVGSSGPVQVVGGMVGELLLVDVLPEEVPVPVPAVAVASKELRTSVISGNTKYPIIKTTTNNKLGNKNLLFTVIFYHELENGNQEIDNGNRILFSFFR
jgi:hypothetical protein